VYIDESNVTGHGLNVRDHKHLVTRAVVFRYLKVANDISTAAQISINSKGTL
jgi:hypothetical protein